MGPDSPHHRSGGSRVCLLAITPPGPEFDTLWTLWLWRSALVLVSASLFLPMVWLGGRYVLRAERLADGRVHFVIWSLLGRSDRFWLGPAPDLPTVRESSHKRWGPILHLRALVRLALRELVGRRYRLSPDSGAVMHEGRTHIPGRVWVDAPYLSLHPARGKQLIIDMQADFPRGVEAFLRAISAG